MKTSDPRPFDLPYIGMPTDVCLCLEYGHTLAADGRAVEGAWNGITAIREIGAAVEFHLLARLRQP